MHENARVPNDLHGMKPNSLNPSHHPHYPPTEKVMVRNPSQNQQTQCVNPHYEFMISARNAFMKKTTPHVQEGVKTRKNMMQMVPPQPLTPQNVLFMRKK